MITKKLLRFYFSADSLNRAMDNIILHLACRSAEAEGGAESYAQRICRAIEVKGELSSLWARLHSIISRMSERDRHTLERYSALRCTGTLGEEERREIHRATVKFVRRAGGTQKFRGEGYRTLCAYYALLTPDAGAQSFQIRVRTTSPSVCP